MRQTRRPEINLRTIHVAVAFAIGALPFAVQAQPTSAVAPGAKSEAKKDEDKLETIVVTAQRREQELQSVPLPVSTFTSRDLESRGVSSMLKVADYIPNMVAQNNTGLGTANVYFLRALGNTESIATFDPPVGTYVNDVYVSRQNANNFSFFDVERIEVLRGPQGTLFGRNTTGGAMNVILKKPSNKLNGYVEFGGGSFNAFSTRASVDVPMSKDFLTKFSFYKAEDNGYVKNVTTGQRLNAVDSTGVRAAFQWRLGGGMVWDVSADQVKDTGLSLYNADVNGERQSRTGMRTDGPGFGVGPTGAPRFVGEKNGYPLGNNVETMSIASNFGFSWGDIGIELISGWRDTTQKFAIDFLNSTSPTGGFTIANDARHKQFTQEVKLSGATGNLSWVSGLFYMDEKNRTDFGDWVPGLVLGDRLMNNNTKSTAVYFQGDHKLTPQTTLTVGARFTRDEKDIAYTDNRINPPAATALTTANMQRLGLPTSVTNSLTTPRVALSYQVNPDLMLFTSATSGFKSGGWNARSTSAALLTPFGVEKVWSYEAGWRYAFGGGKYRLNGTAFRMDVKDLQTSSAFTPAGATAPTFIIQNFAGLQNQGLELELNAQPVRGFNFYIAAGFQNAKYVDIAPAITAQRAQCRTNLAARAPGVTTIPAGCLQGIVNAQGDIAIPVRSPKKSLNPGFTITLPTGWADVSGTASINWSYSSRINIGTAENAFAEARTLTNASLGLLGGTRWRLILDCTNCTDKVVNQSSLAGLTYLNDPRRVSLKLNMNFK
jgi:iron complex outermembrane recepter protein